MSFLKPSENIFGLAYSLQVKQIMSQPSPWVVGFFVFLFFQPSTSLCHLFFLSFSAILLPLWISMRFFFFMLIFFVEHFCRILPFSFWVYQLSAHRMDSSISPTSSISSCVLLEDLFLVSHLAILCVERHLCCLTSFFFPPATQ